jgi:hypothetical protein
VKPNAHIRHFLLNFLHPRVYIFIVAGTGIIFLTFLTSSNAVEIAISGAASIFIGIGVNNLSALEIQSKDGQKLKIKIAHAIRIMQLLENRVKQNIDHADNDRQELLKEELRDLHTFIQVSIELVKEDSHL